MGNAGEGKSTIASKAVKELNVTALHMCKRADARRQDPLMVARSLLFQLLLKDKSARAAVADSLGLRVDGTAEVDAAASVQVENRDAVTAVLLTALKAATTPLLLVDGLDEAESRGIRYDDQKMSRLMDVVGDGRDVVRMCIDATHFSNLGRFLNHSCDPNVFKQRVFCDHNPRLPRIALFALRDIPPLEELAYDYGYQDVPGKTVPCLCEADNCSKLLY